MGGRTLMRSRMRSGLRRGLLGGGATGELKRIWGSGMRLVWWLRRIEMGWAVNSHRLKFVPPNPCRLDHRGSAPCRSRLGLRRWRAVPPRISIIGLFFLVMGSLFAAGPDPVQWTLTFDVQAAPPGSHVLGHLTAKLEPGWHLYSLTTPRPPIATTETLADNPAVGGFRVYQPKPVVKLDPTFKVNTETFADDVKFLFDIH